MTVEPGGDGAPRRVRAGRRWQGVAEVREVWRIDDEWWRERPVSRLYFHLLLEDGQPLTVYYDLLAGGWAAQQAS